MIKATVIADSINPEGKRITTLELEYPRFIHGEFMTHRLFSRNAASSRAIPAKTMRTQVWNEPAMPIYWGKNQAGMKARDELSPRRKALGKFIWKMTGRVVCVLHMTMEKLKVHKQICNRIIEPWQQMKTVMTATEFGNFQWLRDHEDAQPEIAKLAECMKYAMKASIPKKLAWGQWHLPYAEAAYGLSIAERKAISISCCAQVSYRKTDTSLDKAFRIADSLLSGSRAHASPFEHQALCSKQIGILKGWTHTDMQVAYWSGNFKGWIQNRHYMGLDK